MSPFSLTRVGLVNFLSSLAILSVFTYIPYWGKIIGLTDPEIALAATLYGIVAFASGILSGRLSDLLGVRKIFVIIGLLSGSVTIFGLIIPNELEFLLFRALSGIGIGMFAPALVGLVSDKGDKMGNFSAYGAFGWAVGVLISGVIGLYWIEGIFIFGGFSFFVAAILAFTIHEERVTQKKYKDSVVTVFWKRKRGYLALTIRHSFATAIWTFWALFLTDLGATTFWIAVIQCTNATTQSIVMNKFTDAMNSQKMISLGLLVSSITFISFTIPPTFVGIIPLQILLGVSWSFLYVGTLRYSVEKSRFDKATASGIITSIMAVSNILGSLIALIVSLIGGSYIDIIVSAAVATLLTFLIFVFFERTSESLSAERGNLHD
ncbi:MAG: MFS transporter [Promethearchaeota archaeon]|jgi:MFS family permease